MGKAIKDAANYVLKHSQLARKDKGAWFCIKFYFACRKLNKKKDDKHNAKCLIKIIRMIIDDNDLMFQDEFMRGIYHINMLHYKVINKE